MPSLSICVLSLGRLRVVHSRIFDLHSLLWSPSATSSLLMPLPSPSLSEASSKFDAYFCFLPPHLKWIVISFYLHSGVLLLPWMTISSTTSLNQASHTKCIILVSVYYPWSTWGVSVPKRTGVKMSTSLTRWQPRHWRQWGAIPEASVATSNDGHRMTPTNS